MSWSNKGTFKFNDYATQLISHFDTLERGGQGKTNKEKVMKLLNLMSTNNVAVCTRMELNRQGVTFQDAIVSLSTSIATLFPLIDVKGHKALVSETKTGGEVTNQTHINGVEFTESIWKKSFSTEESKCIPKQVRRLIGFAKHHKYDEKQHAYKAEVALENKKRGRCWNTNSSTTSTTLDFLWTPSAQQARRLFV